MAEIVSFTLSSQNLKKHCPQFPSVPLLFTTTPQLFWFWTWEKKVSLGGVHSTCRESHLLGSGHHHQASRPDMTIPSRKNTIAHWSQDLHVWFGQWYAHAEDDEEESEEETAFLRLLYSMLWHSHGGVQIFYSISGGPSDLYLVSWVSRGDRRWASIFVSGKLLED